MTRLQWILLLAVLGTWIPAYLMFFFLQADAAGWWRRHREQRVQKRKDHAERVAEQGRLREELAAKYIPSASGPGPRTS